MSFGSDAVFAQIDGSLHALEETAFELEDHLQRLVAVHPELLAGAQIDPSDPRRFALVAREVPVPDRAEGSGRWALDHLFIDQDAIPTLVEVKRASNSQLRREVVGQLLDYAANAVRYWRAEDLVHAFNATHHDEAHEVLAELTDEAPEEFWRRAESNLSNGRVRLVFLADRIPVELQGIVEFLNERTDPTEVLAVEVKQYRSHDGPQVLVPRVIGATAVARTIKRTSVPYDELVAQADTATQTVERRLLDWAEQNDVITEFTATARKFASKGGAHLFLFYPAWGQLEFTMPTIRAGDRDLADQLLERMRTVSTKRVTDKHPILMAGDVLAAWPDFTAILEQYLQARRRFSTKEGNPRV